MANLISKVKINIWPLTGAFWAQHMRAQTSWSLAGVGEKFQKRISDLDNEIGISDYLYYDK